MNFKGNIIQPTAVSIAFNMVTLTVSPPLTTAGDDVLAGHLGATVHLLDFQPRCRDDWKKFPLHQYPKAQQRLCVAFVNIKINLTNRVRVTAFRCAEMHWLSLLIGHRLSGMERGSREDQAERWKWGTPAGYYCQISISKSM